MWDGRTSSRWRPRNAQIADYLRGWVAELAGTDVILLIPVAIARRVRRCTREFVVEKGWERE
jgi:hypothetical protein